MTTNGQQNKRQYAMNKAQQDSAHAMRYYGTIAHLLAVLQRDRRNQEVLTAFDFRVRQTAQQYGRVNVGEMAKYIAWTVYPLFGTHPLIMQTALDYGRSPLDVTADVCWRYVRTVSGPEWVADDDEPEGGE